jgi:hypothetical protein
MEVKFNVGCAETAATGSASPPPWSLSRVPIPGAEKMLTYLGHIWSLIGMLLTARLDFLGQVGVALARGSKNLAKVETRNREEAQREGTEQARDVKGKIVEYLWHLKKQGYAESTVKTRVKCLKRLAREADIFDRSPLNCYWPPKNGRTIIKLR